MSSTILMAVSIFNGRNHPRMENGDQFQGVGNDGKDIIIGDCKSQGESIVRYFLKRMPPEDEVNIIMLCSRKTLEMDEKNGDDSKGKIHSAVSYLKERIDESPEKGKHKINYQVIKLYKNQLPTEHRLQEADIIDPSIPLIPASREEECYFPDDELGAIAMAAEFIRSQKNQEKRSFRLYIDTHGGLRDVVIALGAVISLLSVGEAIRPKMIMGINMASGRIEDQSAAFNIFSFFSGINDFLHFGNADVLSEYFDSKNEFSYLTGADPAVQKIAKQTIEHMKKISLGAQMSDPKAFIEGLKELGNEFQTGVSEDGKSILKGTSLGIFEQKIKDEYGDLLKAPNILDLIIWCVNRGLIQQALTFIESMLPYYYREKKILYFDNEELKNFEEDEYSAFNRYLNKFRFEKQDRDKEPAFYVYQMVEKTGTNTVSWAKPGSKTLLHYRIENDFLEVKSKWIRKDKRGNILLDDFIKKVVPLLQSHRTLKIIRNVFNHGNPDYRVSLTNLKKLIIDYISDLKKLKK